MHPRQDPSADLVRLASAQARVLACHQVLAAGLGRHSVSRLLATGRWTRWEPGLYLVDRSTPDWLTHVWAGLLLGGKFARAGGLTAARLDELTKDDFLPVTIRVPTPVRPTPRSWVRWVAETPGGRAASSGAEPARTRIEDTVLDLCAASPPGEALRWVRQSAYLGPTTPDRVRRAAGRRSRLRHRRAILLACADVEAGVHSELERRYRDDVEKAHGLPRPSRQSVAAGIRLGYVDTRYDPYGLVVEPDGRVGHTGDGRVRDRRRDNAHMVSGARTLRFGWWDITEDACACAADVVACLRLGGWTGRPQRCRLCPPE